MMQCQHASCSRLALSAPQRSLSACCVSCKILAEHTLPALQWVCQIALTQHAVHCRTLPGPCALPCASRAATPPCCRLSHRWTPSPGSCSSRWTPCHSAGTRPAPRSQRMHPRSTRRALDCPSSSSRRWPCRTPRTCCRGYCPTRHPTLCRGAHGGRPSPLHRGCSPL